MSRGPKELTVAPYGRENVNSVALLKLGDFKGAEPPCLERDDRLLLAVDSTRENHKEEMPGLQDETHGQPVDSRVIAKWFTIALSRAHVNMVPSPSRRMMSR